MRTALFLSYIGDEGVSLCGGSVQAEGLYPEGSLSGTSPDRDPLPHCGQNDWQTDVKTLPSATSFAAGHKEAFWNWYGHLVKFRGGSRIPCRRGADPPGGTNIRFCRIFHKNCMQLKEFGPGGCIPHTAIGSATAKVDQIVYWKHEILKTFIERSFYWSHFQQEWLCDGVIILFLGQQIDLELDIA